MKKLFYLLLMLPFAFFASCSDDDDLPQVDLTLTLSGVTQYDGAFYAVQPQPSDTENSQEDSDDISDSDVLPEGVITVDSFTAKSLNNKNAGVANVAIYIDGLFVPPTFETPYITAISTANLPVGTHSLSVTANVLEVDKSIANAALNYPLKIVASADDLPDGAPAIGTYSVTVRNQSK